MRARRLRADAQQIRGKKRTRKGWSDATINRHFSFLRHVLMLAMKEGFIALESSQRCSVLSGVKPNQIPQ
jgi:hypothetical protein